MENNDLEPKSKGQRKREAEALQALGERLTRLKPQQLDALDLPEALRSAIAMAQKLQNQRGALRRQMQYIGRLMRDIDPAPLQQALAALQAPAKLSTAQQQLATRWRDRLLQEGETALQHFVQEHPHADHEHLRQLMHQAVHEQQQHKPPAAARLIYRYIYDLIKVTSDK